MTCELNRMDIVDKLFLSADSKDPTEPLSSLNFFCLHGNKIAIVVRKTSSSVGNLQVPRESIPEYGGHSFSMHFFQVVYYIFQVDSFTAPVDRA